MRGAPEALRVSECLVTGLWGLGEPHPSLRLKYIQPLMFNCRFNRQLVARGCCLVEVSF